MALSRWGEHIPLNDTTSPGLGIDALIFTLMTKFDSTDAADLDAVIHLRLDDDHFRLTIRKGQLLAKRAEVDDADTTITTTSSTLQSLVFAERTLADTERTGDTTITGNRGAATRLLQFSPTPQQNDTAPTKGTG